MARIVVVDDSKYLSNSIKKFLEANGHDVVATGADGEEGIELYREHQPDLILLDITMPIKGGKECLDGILEINPSARALIVSAVKEPGAVMSCLQAGAKGFIEKPLKFSDDEFCNEFRGAIQDALAA